jgi:hypothetical protein
LFGWIDSEELDVPALKDLLGEHYAPLPSNKAIARALMFVPSLASFALRRGGEPPEPEFLAATASSLRYVWEGVIDIRNTAQQQAEDLAAAWVQVLEQRTGLQFLADWYGDRLAGEVRALELDGLDVAMRGRTQVAGFVRVTDVPAGVPRSHWWWNLP